MASEVFSLNSRGSGRSLRERYLVAEMNYPLVPTAVYLLSIRRDLSAEQAFAELEELAGASGLNLDEASARVIYDA